ncbi:MAG: hypothetical protein OXI43_02890 [Candidatus Poribacteria bacterium]|nr:hypothetical protein [Candidatus Poribacteria bacterium]
MSIKNTFIAFCLVLLLIAVGPLLYRQNVLQPNSAVATPSEKKPVEVRFVKSYPNKDINTSSKTSNEFYQLIVDNNIFRPLGWHPPKKTPQYTLIGTTISSNGSDAKAFILERRSNQFHTVKVGETIGNVSIKKILPKKVILQEEGKETVLQCGKLQFLR